MTTLTQYGGGESILVADDEPVVLSLARVILNKHGYQVLVAKDGAEALERKREAGSVDLLLTDVIMPNMTGPELAHTLKQEMDGLRCIFMSGYDQEHLQSEGVQNVGCDYLKKPFTPEALLRKVRQALDGDR